MGLEVTRIYKNSDEDTLRVDNVRWTPTDNTFNTGTAMRTYSRRVYTTMMDVSNVTDRVVAIIEIIHNAHVRDETGPPYNYQWVKWTRSNGEILGKMDDLPIITDTV